MMVLLITTIWHGLLVIIAAVGYFLGRLVGTFVGGIAAGFKRGFEG